MKLITKNDKLYVYDPSKDKYYLLSESDLDFVIDDSETTSDGKPKLLSDEQVRRYLEDKYGPKKKTKEQQQGFYSKKANLKDEYAKVQKSITDNEFIHSVYDIIKDYNDKKSAEAVENDEPFEEQKLSSYDIIRLVKNPTLATVKSFNGINNDLKNEIFDKYSQLQKNNMLESDKENSFLSIFPELIDVMLTGNSDVFENTAKDLYIGILQDIEEYKNMYNNNPDARETRKKWKEIQTNLKQLLKASKLVPKRSVFIRDLQKQINDTIALHKNMKIREVPELQVLPHPPVPMHPRKPRSDSFDPDNAMVITDSDELRKHHEEEMKKSRNKRETEFKIDKSSSSSSFDYDIIEPKQEVKETSRDYIPIETPIEPIVPVKPINTMPVADIEPIQPIVPIETIPIENIEQIQEDYKTFDNSDLMKDPGKIGFQKAFRFMKWVESEPEYLDEEYTENIPNETEKEYIITIKDDEKPIYKVSIIGNKDDSTFNELIEPIRKYKRHEINKDAFTKQLRQLPSKLSKKTGKNEGSSIKFQIEPFDQVEIGDENVQEFIESHNELFDPTKTTMNQFLNYLDGLAPERKPNPELPHYPMKDIDRTSLYPRTMDETRMSKEDYERLSPNNSADKSILLGTLTKGLVTMDQDGIKQIIENSFSWNPFSKNNRDYSKILGVLIDKNRYNGQYKYQTLKKLYKDYKNFRPEVEEIIDQFADKQYKVYGYPGKLDSPITNANNDWYFFNPNAVQQNLFYDYMYRNTDNMFSKGKLSRILMKKINSRPLDRRPYSGIKPDGHDLANILKMSLNAHN